MRWLKSFAVCAGVAARLAQAVVPESLAEAFVSGMTLTVKFGDTTVLDDDTISAGSITSSPVFTLNSPNVPIPDNTRYTIVLMDITDSRDPTTEATLHYAASNLQAPASNGGELKFGTVNFEYVAPTAGSNAASYIFLVYGQLDGNIELNLESVPEAGEDRKFSISGFRSDNGFQLADTGIGFTVESAASADSTTSAAPSVSSSTSSFTFPNSTTTTSSSFLTTTPEPSTSYLTLSVSGSTKTVVYTAPNDPGSTLGASSTSSTANPSVITNEPNAASQKVVSRSAIALLGFCAAFVAFA